MPIVLYLMILPWRDLEEEPIEEEPLEEPKEEGKYKSQRKRTIKEEPQISCRMLVAGGSRSLFKDSFGSSQEGKVVAKFSKCEFWLQEVHFLIHIVNNNGVHMELSKIKAMKTWKVPKTPSEIRSFLGLAVYCDASNQGFKCVLLQRGKVIIDYDCEVCYHPGKADVVAGALSRKEKVKPIRVRAMFMTTQSGVKDKILTGQSEASKVENTPAEMLRSVRTLIMDEAHASRYSIHSGADMTYYNLRDMYWSPCMKKDIAIYVSDCLTCSKMKAETSKTFRNTARYETDGKSECIIQNLEDMLRACVIDFGEEPVEIKNLKVKWLKRSRLPIVKVR
uniref:Putative reverse transcriptase domain-containing protein n=1 Tax=Tanacetum cinerariifolium TaxID=118510 RepID=A0A6L2PC90_TANCI|nr:putative reverse transcriptase domain-containing protein [Tanacetum cinerariifolium]